MNLQQIKIAFGKYVSGYRPFDEGWTDEDNEILEWVLKIDNESMTHDAVLADVTANDIQLILDSIGIYADMLDDFDIDKTNKLDELYSKLKKISGYFR